MNDDTQVRLDDKDETMGAGPNVENPTCGTDCSTKPIEPVQYPSVASQQHTFDVSLRVRAFELALGTVQNAAKAIEGAVQEAADIVAKAEIIYAYLTKPRA